VKRRSRNYHLLTSMIDDDLYLPTPGRSKR
jgi:hypothetical protein